MLQAVFWLLPVFATVALACAVHRCVGHYVGAFDCALGHDLAKFLMCLVSAQDHSQGSDPPPATPITHVGGVLGGADTQSDCSHSSTAAHTPTTPNTRQHTFWNKAFSNTVSTACCGPVAPDSRPQSSSSSSDDGRPADWIVSPQRLHHVWRDYIGASDSVLVVGCGESLLAHYLVRTSRHLGTLSDQTQHARQDDSGCDEATKVLVPFQGRICMTDISEVAISKMRASLPPRRDHAPDKQQTKQFPNGTSKADDSLSTPAVDSSIPCVEWHVADATSLQSSLSLLPVWRSRTTPPPCCPVCVTCASRTSSSLFNVVVDKGTSDTLLFRYKRKQRLSMLRLMLQSVWHSLLPGGKYVIVTPRKRIPLLMDSTKKYKTSQFDERDEGGHGATGSSWRLLRSLKIPLDCRGQKHLVRGRACRAPRSCIYVHVLCKVD